MESNLVEGPCPATSRARCPQQHRWATAGNVLVDVELDGMKGGAALPEP